MSETFSNFFNSNSGRIVTLVLAAAAFILIAGYFFKKAKLSTKALTYTALCIALATILSYIKPVSLPFGGSITFCSMFFISIVGFWFGPAVGIISGITYGLLQLAIDPYVIHPIQMLLDYPIAFGVIGFSGFFANKKYGLYTGFVVGCLSRFLVSSLSGYIFFADYAPEGQNAILYTLTYNISYIAPEILITLIIISIPVVRNAFLVIKKQMVNSIA